MCPNAHFEENEMSALVKVLTGAAGLAAVVGFASPAAAQYYPGYGYNNGGGVVGAIVNSVLGGGQYGYGQYGYGGATIASPSTSAAAPSRPASAGRRLRRLWLQQLRRRPRRGDHQRRAPQHGLRVRGVATSGALRRLRLQHAAPTSASAAGSIIAAGSPTSISTAAASTATTTAIIAAIKPD